MLFSYLFVYCSKLTLEQKYTKDLLNRASYNEEDLLNDNHTGILLNCF